jgi:hypothetical protein
MAVALSRKRLLLCEGIDDAEFLRALIKKRQLGGYDVIPVRDLGGVPGNSGFRLALIAVISVTNFGNVDHVGLVSDGDTHYGATFGAIKRQIETANQHASVAHRFGVPAAPYQVGGGKTRVTVLLLPAVNTPGALETSLWPAFCSVAAHQATKVQVEAACNALGLLQGATSWSPARRAKALVHAGLALSFNKDPGLTLGRLFRRFPDLMPLDHASFDGLANALRGL